MQMTVLRFSYTEHEKNVKLSWIKIANVKALKYKAF